MVGPSEAAIQKANTPLSDVDAAALQEWVDSQKPLLNRIEGDVRDSKRRIAAVKAPKRKAKVEEPQPSDGSQSDGGMSDEGN